MQSKDLPEAGPKSDLEGVATGGCSLQFISGFYGGWAGPYGEQEGEKLKDLVNLKGSKTSWSCVNFIKASLVSLSDSQIADKALMALFKELGFVELGSFPGAHGTYKMHLFGKNFTLPEKK